jgi:hypothetical protein
MTRTNYPAPALIVLVACGIVMSCASQQGADYDVMWFGICTALFVAGCLVAFNIVRSLPATPVKITMTHEMWRRSQYGMIIGVLCLPVALGWLLWAFQAIPGGTWTSIAIVMGPTLALGVAGLMLIYYWLGLWAFGHIEEGVTINKDGIDKDGPKEE